MIDDTQHEDIEDVLECLLNRGLSSEEDTVWFTGVRHADLSRVLLSYLNAHRHYLGYCHIDDRQALNDRGVDILLESEGFIAGFQIKTHADVTDENFSANVKRQIAESLSYELDHYYLLICAPLADDKRNFRMRIAHLLNDISLYRGLTLDAFGPLNTVTVFRNPPRVSREELLIRRAISDDCLQEYEKGYEHLPEIDDYEIRAAEKHLEEFGDDWWDVDGGLEAFNALQETIYRKRAEQFAAIFAPTLPPEITQRRAVLIAEIKNALSQCRRSKHWRDKDEDLLPNHYLDGVPEEMIPYTSIPNLLRIRQKVGELLEYHQKVPPRLVSPLTRFDEPGKSSSRRARNGNRT